MKIKSFLKIISILYIFHHDFLVQWTEFQGECQDANSKIFDACILASQFPECSGHCYSGRVARAALLTPVPPPALPRLASHSGVHIHHSSVQHPASTTVEPWPSHRVENWSVIWISSILSKFIYHKNVDRFITFIVICTNYFYFYFESTECWG